ncbi:ricin-type beta-trefoil lectin domain protein [Lentzea sp. NPDC051838]|uniref:RICIN domain-containing protein n=1 Tax=Lentzea sp. NPDC051838 TaxID=3154849 RepID=UPI0034445E21
MADVTNTTGGVEGDTVQIGSIGGDVNFYSRFPKLLLVALAVVVVAAVVLVVVLHPWTDEQPGAAPSTTSAPPLISTPPATSESAAVPTTQVRTGSPERPAGQTAKQPTPQPTQPPVLPAPGPVKAADDGPGYLMPGNTEKVADLYDGSKEAVMWTREPAGTDGAKFQPNWVREFSDSGAFRIRNTHANLCLETATEAAARLEQVLGRTCSWSREHQLWRAQNGNQYANVRSGECLVAGESDTYPDGTWLVVWTCESKSDQQWRVAP